MKYIEYLNTALSAEESTDCFLHIGFAVGEYGNERNKTSQIFTEVINVLYDPTLTYDACHEKCKKLIPGIIEKLETEVEENVRE